MMSDWSEIYDIDEYRSPEELARDERWADIRKLNELRIYQYYRPGNREKYLRQLKRCMKYGEKYVNEARRIRKWGKVKKPKLISY